MTLVSRKIKIDAEMRLAMLFEQGVEVDVFLAALRQPAIEVRGALARRVVRARAIGLERPLDHFGHRPPLPSGELVRQIPRLALRTES